MKKKGIALALSASLLVLHIPPIANLPPARADDSDIFGATVQPNVLILIDTSASMNDEVDTHLYVASTTYAVVNKCGSGSSKSACVSTVVYQKTGSGSSSTYTLYKNTVADVTGSPCASCPAARTALSTTGYWSGTIGGSSVSLFLGNYLNSQLGLCAAPPCREPKITIAKRVISNLIANTEGVRFGTMKFKPNCPGCGGEIVSPIGSSTSILLAGVNALTAPGGSGTPLGEQIRDAGLYYKGQFGFPSPIQFECQANFAIIVSDGLSTGTDPRLEANKLRTEDHSSAFDKTQYVIVHTVGFGLPQGDKDAGGLVALQETAGKGGGSFYPADNASQLEQALQDAIRQIVAATFAFATPVIPTTSATGATKSNRAYLASFQSDPSRPAWKGFLKAYQRDSNGNIRVKADGTPDETFRDWESGEALASKAASSRTIKTEIRGTLQDFNTSNSNITPGLLGVAGSVERDKLVNFIRGVDTYDEDADGNVTEERAWKLGDIFHSAPVLVTPPFLPIPLVDPAPSYRDFKAANANREPVLIAGANDGMLHAFRESDGQELWAFIPNDLLGSLKTLTATSADHPFYVDGSPIVADVKIGGTWKTIVVFGERRGGRFYHALDITDTTNPLYLWSFTDSKMGETWSEPVIGRVKMDPSTGSTEKYVAIVGGGYDTVQNNNSGKALFVIDVATGQKLFESFNTGSATDDRRFMNFSLPSNPTAVDLNRDAFIDGVYIGDVGGQLWKFDLSPAATISGGLVTNWTGKRLFAADPSQKNPPDAGEYYPKQAIYAAPVPALDKSNNLWIFFGAGDRNHPNNTTAPNRFYGIKDDTTMANGSTLTESNLANISASDTTPTQGWFFLLGSDEKVLAAADVFNMIVFFSSFIPTTTTACGTGGGTAIQNAVQMLTGYAAVDFALGVELLTTGASATRGKIIGTGIPSKPVILLTESEGTISTSVIVATTSQQLPSNPVPPPSAMRKVLYWREVF